MIFKMIRPHVMFFSKWQSLSSGVLCANPTQKYPNCIFEYYFHLPQHTSARATFHAALVHAESKAQNRRKVEDDMRLA